MEERQHKWADIIADALEKNLLLYEQGKVEQIHFSSDIEVQDAALSDPRNLAGLNLSAASNFGDTFFDAAENGDRQVEGVPWEDAVQLLRDVVETLRNHRDIEDVRVLRYMQRPRKPAWWKRFL